MTRVTAEGYGTYTRSAECVGPHPDKLADTISDAIVQEHLEHDPNSHVGVETLCASNGTVTLAGEIKSTHVPSVIDYERLARETIREAGWNNPDWEYYPDRIPVAVKLKSQSADIDQGVTKSDHKVGAGDQGIMIGFAEDEGVPQAHYMPVPFAFSRDLLWTINRFRQDKASGIIKPDMKSGAVIAYEDGVPKQLLDLFLAVAHDPSIDKEQLMRELWPSVEEVLDAYKFQFDRSKLRLNNTGKFSIAGPIGDSGLTGRKGPIDTFGQFVPYGGGALSGKDPSKIDRSWPLDARWIAKNIVAAGMAGKCKVTITGLIGQEDPVDIQIDTYESEHVPLGQIIAAVQAIDFSVASTIERHGLRTLPRKGTLYYPDLAANGHFGGHQDGSTDRSARPWETIVPPEKWPTWKYEQNENDGR